MRIKALQIFLVQLSCLVLFASVSLAKPEYSEAVNKVADLYKKHGGNISRRSMECIYFNVDGMSPEGGVAVSARELRSSSCGGDPLTTRMIASFLVKGDVVYVEDIDTGDLTPFDENYLKKPR